MSKRKDEAIHDVIATENGQAAAGGQNYEFITETIKKKPINKRRVFGKFVLTVILAVVFGAVASVTFTVLSPHIEKFIHPEELLAVSLPGEELSASSSENNDQNVETEEIVGDNVNAASEDKPTEVVTHVVTTVEKKLEVNDYKHLYQEMSTIAYEAKRSMVTVTGVYSDVDWLQNSYSEDETTSGLIVADNGREYLIIAQADPIEDADSVKVTFCDGTILDASVKKIDSQSGLSIIGVEISDLSEASREKICKANLGSSQQASLVGSPIIALGNPLGIADSRAIGQVTSNSYVKSLADSSVQYLTTDIYGSKNASGVLIDMDGSVLGIIYPDNSLGDTPNLVKAYGISDLKGKIEKLSNGQDLAFLGVMAMDVTPEASQEYGIPDGAYVKEVVIDSPAMEAGIQNGDVITKLGTAEIKSFKDYKDAMLKCQPGDLMMVTLQRYTRFGYQEVSYEITLDKAE